MNSYISATLLNKPLKSYLLGVVQYISGCIQKNDDVVGRQRFIVEGRGVFSGVNYKAMFLSKCSNGRMAISNGSVPITFSQGKNEDPFVR